MKPVSNPLMVKGALENKGIDTLKRLSKSSDKKDMDALKKACSDFEAVFVRQLLKNMRRTVMKSGLLEGGMRQELYQEMFDGEVSKVIAERGAFGVRDMLLNYFTSK